MLSKSECRDFINQRKPFLNLSRISREIGVQQASVSWFLKDEHYNHYLSVEKANQLVDFISRLSNS